MLYFLAILLPPLAGKPGAAILNVFLCLLFWLPGVIHALFVVNEAKADARARKYGTPAGG